MVNGYSYAIITALSFAMEEVNEKNCYNQKMYGK